MNIGLDLSVIQTPHRMRGIGATAINFVKHLPNETKQQHSFVLFLYPEEQNKALDILDLKDINYEVRNLQKQERINLSLPGKLRKLNGPLNSIRSILKRRKGDPRVHSQDLTDLDAYLQFDQMQIPPKERGLKTLVILYDLIPYIMEADYLWSYSTARRHGDSRKSSLRKALLRYQYVSEVRTVCRQATKLIAISSHTKKDFIKFAGVDAKKIQVVHLGIEQRKSPEKKKNIQLHQYVENSWGYLKKPIDLSGKPYVLFIGGADPRRKLIDLVAAYNNLKALGIDIRLVLAGDTMKGAKAIPVAEVQKYISNSSYLDDIIFLGFVTDQEREYLYENALVFVYPSLYEGFGLPVLEAESYGTPVITYDNTSIREIAADSVIYANNAISIKSNIFKLLTGRKLRTKYKLAGIMNARNYSWDKTVQDIINLVSK